LKDSRRIKFQMIL